MSQNIIHIGYHKTGTTWFQNEFYPLVRNKEYISRKEVQKLFLSKGGLSFDANSVKNYIGEKYPKEIIICEEELSGNIHTGGHHGFLTSGMCERLDSVFSNPQIIIFIRNQIDIIASTYKQYIKKGGNHSIEKYLFHEDTYPHRKPLFSFEHFDYYKFISKYEKKFGKENLKIFAFEKFLENKHEFINDYIKKFDFDINEEKIDYEAKNPSFGKLSLNLAKLRNLFTNKDVLYKYYILDIPYVFKGGNYILNKINQMNWISYRISTEELLGEKLIHQIKKYYKDSNKLLSNRYGLDLEKYDYPL